LTNPKQDDTDEKDASELAGADLRMEISEVLTVITGLVPHVMSLTDSRNPAELGFMTFEARQAQNQIARKERRLRIEGQKQGRPLGHGTTAAPGNIHGLSVDVELWATARHLTRWLTRHGATEIRVSDGADTLELLGVITQLVDTITDDKVLRAALIDLRPARDSALRLVDGAGNYRPATPCIHCGLPTLIVDKVRGIATCGGDAKTGRISPCICSDPVCGCKTDPIKHRHKWYRNRLKAQDGWLTLTSRIELQQKARNETNPEEPTMSSPTDTTKADPIVNFGVLATAGGIEEQEAAGMAELLASTSLPSSMSPGQAAFEDLGFTFGDIFDGDPLFVHATLPAGWARKASDDARCSYIVDERGMARVSIFYKAAFYDRKADMHLVNPGRSLATEWIYGDDPELTLSPLLTDDERDALLDSAKSYLEDVARSPEIYGDRESRARALVTALEGAQS